MVRHSCETRHAQRHEARSDEETIRSIACADFDRTPNLRTTFNHASLEGATEWMGRMGEIAAPTLIIHGTQDPVLPYGHALARQAGIRNATLLTLQDRGHELHRADWRTIVQAIAEHTSS